MVAQPGQPRPAGHDVAGAHRASRDAVSRLVTLQRDVDQLLRELDEAQSLWSPWLAAVAKPHRGSARNLVDYWAIRQHDLRDLQSRLASFGLSSLGRSEAHVAATLLLVHAAIGAMFGNGWHPRHTTTVGIDAGPRLLRQRANDLLGPSPAGRPTRIMVTLPSEAATNADLVGDLVQRGMNVARINCAHDDAPAWRAMARNVRQAAETTGRTCLVAMDLAGPKLRTGPLEPGPRVIKLRPQKDLLGRISAPTQAWLTSAEDPAAPPRPVVTIPVPGEWLRRRRTGDVLRLSDTRGASRELILYADEQATGFVAEAAKTTYVGTGTVLHVAGGDDAAQVGTLPEVQQSLVLHRGDLLELTRDCSAAPVHPGGQARIGCTLPEIFDHARVGEKVLIDDGQIGGQVVRVDTAVLTVRIDHAATNGSKLRADKGVNVPQTRLPIDALTAKDIADLSVVAEVADLVEMSFVREPSDVERLLDQVNRLGAQRLGIILKIETSQAFEHLPQLLLTVMRHPRAGVMIARGDLAVECGYDRLAELQEEILWLCEAAHLPVIWATQVLEQLAQTGDPSRAEISDAAMSERAECVMLNKGPYIDDAVVLLDKILRRMAEHLNKKFALLRSLHSWHPSGTPPAAPAGSRSRSRGAGH
ncbi:MAG TPA: pyruvate kinase [Mycobacterium sp.]|nr:pyruvate kinase [Mycobacterium sp.]